MATLNTSAEGSAITKAYQSVVNAPDPSGGAASSPTFAQWAVYSVQAPLVSAFQNDPSKESVLKVFRTGEGELEDLVEEFSEGKVQFAFLKVKDPNTTLRKSVLIAWCGEGVPERTKGYFTSHLATVSKILHGYHVQVTARSDGDLTPEGIIQKVQDSSGSKYSGGGPDVSSKPAPSPPVATKPVFTPSRVGGSGVSGGLNPINSRSRQPAPQSNTDDDGWGADAPPVSRSQLEKVESAYKPTKVNMAELTGQKQEPSRFVDTRAQSNTQEDVVKGGYQPIGKVDLAAIRREAQEKGSAADDRPVPVKGAYEPVGKVDIAAIRARAQPSQSSPPPAQSPAAQSPAVTGDEPKSLSDRSAAFTQSERLTAMPKPKVANKFGGASSFTGTKAPSPGGLEAKPAAPSAATTGMASRTFADEGGKTPAQLWAERKARERGSSGAAEGPKPTATAASPASPASTGQWESGYTGKKWAPIQTTRTGQSTGESVDQQQQQDEPTSPEVTGGGGVSAMRDRFKDAAPMGGAAADSPGAPAPPPMDLSSKPNAGARGVPIPGMPQPAQDEQEEEEEEDSAPAVRSSSPIRVAQPVARSEPQQQEPEPEPEPQPIAQPAEPSPKPAGGKRARVEYDYEAAEDNEISLVDGAIVENIDTSIDDDWWMGTNAQGHTGLFPSNYVTLLDGDEGAAEPASAGAGAASVPEPAAPADEQPTEGTKTAIAQYDYEAAEDNELSFPEGARIVDVEFPDEDWWAGSYNGHTGLFPANYVTLED